MRYHIITLFPDAFRSYLGESILKRAIDPVNFRLRRNPAKQDIHRVEEPKIAVKFYNPRDFADNKWRRIDRAPYGGGPGMVIQAEPVILAVEAALKAARGNHSLIRANKRIEKLKTSNLKLKTMIVWLSPSGKQFDTAYAKTAAKKFSDIIIICGRYEGIDARVKKAFKVEEVSVGPYVLTGGELPAMLMMDSISRQIPGVLGDINSLEENRIASPDVYTRPEVFKYKNKKYKVPKVLLSGHHKKIEQWKAGRRT